MTTSPDGRTLIEIFEGLRLRAYQDQNGIWTIGSGHTEGVREGDICDFHQADQWLSDDLCDAEKVVNDLVAVPLNQNQFDALVSFVFNVGAGNFKRSTVLQALNAGHYEAAAAALLMWNRTGGVVNKGLAARRDAERKLFLKPTGESGIDA